jgi:hypothetical protein
MSKACDDLSPKCELGERLVGMKISFEGNEVGGWAVDHLTDDDFS